MRVVALDTETGLSCSGRQAPPLVCLTYCDEEGAGLVQGNDTRLYAILRGWLTDPEVRVVGHNFVYDLGVLVERFPDLLPLVHRALEAGRIGCTMIRQMLLDIALGRMHEEHYQIPSLSSLSEQWLGQPLADKAQGLLPPGVAVELEAAHAAALKGPVDPRHYPLLWAAREDVVWRTDYIVLRDLAVSLWPERAKRYAVGDSVTTREVWQRQEEEGWPPRLEDEMRAAWALHVQRCWGIRTDSLYVSLLKARLDEQLARETPPLIEAGVFRADGSEDKKAVKTRVFVAAMEREWRPASPETGRACWAQRVAQVEAQDPEDPVVRAWTELRRLRQAPKRWTPSQAADAAHDVAVLELLLDPRARAVLSALPRTESGQIATSHDDLVASGDPVLRRRADLGGAKKLAETYVPLLEKGAVGLIHARWNVLVASGRTSCSGPNLQNMPRLPGVREAFVARDGYVFLAADLKAAEMCSLAQVLLDMYGYSELALTLQEGKDPHVRTGGAIVGWTYEEAYAKHKAKDPQMKALRQLAKAKNFGLPGGLGAESFVDYCRNDPYNIMLEDYATVEEAATDATGRALAVIVARRLKRMWLEAYPEMRQYFRDISDRVGDRGGRAVVVHPRTRFVRGGLTYTSAANHYFQHLTAASIKAMLYDVQVQCIEKGKGSPLYGSRVVATIHDELFVEIPEAHLTEAAHAVEQTMVRVGQQWTPDIPVAVDVSAMRRWRKGAGEVREEGRLVPWEDRALGEGDVEKIRRRLDKASLYEVGLEVGLELPRLAALWQPSVNL